MEALDQTFWNERWLNKETGWDIGYAAPALCEYIDTLVDKDAAILIPGCGNAYEAEYLLEKGFSNVTLIDIAPDLVKRKQEIYAGKAGIRVICGDFFNHHGEYNLILEQTFFCALDPALRPQYVAQCDRLLAKEGKVAGLLFNIDFEKAGPPFGGSQAEYLTLFSSYFTVNKMEQCRNSIAPRQGSELFFEIQKR